MERNSVDNLENYKWEHLGRMYYANRCNSCFSSKNLRKCGMCESVTYCSKQHQIEDWTFHKPTCIALKKIKKKVPFPEEINSRSFYRYRIELLSQMAKLRSLPHHSLLSEYEQQICMLPWVCTVCFKRPSKHYYCRKCLCIAYCSDEHKEVDKKYHETYCWAWCLCRIINSLNFERGFEVQDFIPYVGIDKNVSVFPEDKFSLSEIMQNIYAIKDEKISLDECINVSTFIEIYMPAAIIINEFELAELIQNRHLVTKSQKTKSCSGRQRKLLLTRAQRLLKKTFVIHFPIADYDELSFEWNQIAELLTDWITNIEKVEVLLASSELRKYETPNFGPLNKVEIAVHKLEYEKVKNLTKPDVIILLQCDRYFGIDRHETLSEEKHKKPFFKYVNVPVIFCDAHAYAISKISKFLLGFQDIECILPLHMNPYPSMNMTRVWNVGFSISVPNVNCAIFRKFE